MPIRPPILAVLLTLAAQTGCGNRPNDRSVDFPARDAANYQALVSAHWLKAALDSQAAGDARLRPATYQGGPLIVLDAYWPEPGKPPRYPEEHIPGAIALDTEQLETGYPEWKLRPVEELHRAIGGVGITPDATVVVYADKLITTARVWWVLKFAGVEDVRILDGGFRAWKRAGYPLDQTSHVLAPVEFTGSVRGDFLATTEYVREHLDDSGVLLADVRSRAEYSGRASGYDYLQAKGRIPSAIHLGDGDDAAGLLCQRDGRLRSPAEILRQWEKTGVRCTSDDQRFDRELVFYCGGGWRSSAAFFCAWLMGRENIRNYSDGWSGWSTLYVVDPNAVGATTGWAQQPTGNPIEAAAR